MTFNPGIDDALLRSLLDELEYLRQEIGALNPPEPLATWLRRQVEARGAHMSTSIEGNPMTEVEVRELFARQRESLDRAELENIDYRDAARFARQVADDYSAEIDEGLIRAFHYLVVRSTYRYESAAQWRRHQNRVADRAGRTVYMPPPPDAVLPLMRDLIAWLRDHRRQVHPVVLAAVAHLEFVNIHPFDDGNGRCARALTTYFLDRHGWGLHGFVSSEATFGRDRPAYYAALAEQGDRYEARSADVTIWCAWVIRSFAVEALTALGVIKRWTEFLEGQPSAAGRADLAWGEMYVILAGSTSRSEYAAALHISPATAVSQLNRLVERGVVRREGQGRATRYRTERDLATEFLDAALQDALARFELA